jgi:protein-disulfide isomerase-like protein with CxxC motif
MTIKPSNASAALQRARYVDKHDITDPAELGDVLARAGLPAAAQEG